MVSGLRDRRYRKMSSHFHASIVHRNNIGVNSWVPIDFVSARENTYFGSALMMAATSPGAAGQ